MVIRYKDDYVIWARGKEYAYGTDTHTLNKDGTPRFNILGIYSTLQSTMQALLKHLIYQQISTHDYDDLESAIADIKKIVEEYKEHTEMMFEDDLK